MEAVVEISVLLRALIEAFYFLIVLLISNFIIGMIRNFSISNLKNSIGNKAVMIIGAIGVPLHQLIHALMAILFAHRIADIKLLQEPDRKNVLGYVDCFKKDENFYQKTGDFFIGIMPLFVGIIFMIFFMKFTIPQTLNSFNETISQNANAITLDSDTLSGIINSNINILKIFFSTATLKNSHFYIFLVISIYISLNMSLDDKGIKGIVRGFLNIFIILMVFNIIDAFNLSNHRFALDIVQFGVLLGGFLEISIVLSFIALLISLILRAITA